MYEKENRAAAAMIGRTTSLGPGSSPERDTPEVMRAINDLRCVVERYDHLVGRLHDRLNCVVTPAPPACSEQCKESGYSTALASSINEARCKLRDITDNLESLYERIEL